MGEIGAIVRSAGGLVLTGGPDVHPSRYGEDVDGSQVSESSVRRDSMEFEAAASADALGLPILAICRGAQVLNVLRGGALLQDIGDSHRDGRAQEDKWMPFHPVEVDGAARLAEVLGSTDAEVNSRHHQAPDPAHLGRGLAVVGRCPHDGVIEAMEGTDPGRFVIAVQWHPENMALGPQDTTERAQARSIFEAFAAAVREHANVARRQSRPAGH
jgi:putative glutamine amidotransferase